MIHAWGLMFMLYEKVWVFVVCPRSKRCLGAQKMEHWNIVKKGCKHQGFWASHPSQYFSNFVLLIRYFISALSHLPPPNSWLLIIKPFSITFNPPLRFCHTITSLLIRFLTKQSMFISFISPYGNHDPLASVWSDMHALYILHVGLS